MRIDNVHLVPALSGGVQAKPIASGFAAKLTGAFNSVFEHAAGVGSGPSDQTTYPEELDSSAKEECPDLQIYSWRLEDRLLSGRTLPDQVHCNKRNQVAAEMHSMVQGVIDGAKLRVDNVRAINDSSLSKEDHALNKIGFYARANSSVLFRVDARTPQELVQSNGFGPSRGVDGIEPMLSNPVLITSASLKGAEKVFEDWSAAMTSHQYSIASEGVEAVSWADNFKYLHEIPDDHGEDFRLDYDEAHVDAERISATEISILDSSEPAVKARIALMTLEGAGSRLGVPIMDFAAHESLVPEVSNGMINAAFIEQMD